MSEVIQRALSFTVSCFSFLILPAALHPLPPHCDNIKVNTVARRPGDDEKRGGGRLLLLLQLMFLLLW